MTHLGAQHRVIGLARVFLEVFERAPGPLQQVFPPTFNELLFKIGNSRLGRGGFDRVGVERETGRLRRW